jgi:hypothetical protein
MCGYRHTLQVPSHCFRSAALCAHGAYGSHRILHAETIRVLLGAVTISTAIESGTVWLGRCAASAELPNLQTVEELLEKYS